MGEQIDLDLDPKKVLDSLTEMSDETKKLASQIEESLGKNATKSIATMEEAAEKGTNKIQGYFMNLGKRVKEDLKSAFDVGKLLSGIKLTNELASGTKQVFEMERAFDRLNTRLGLTGKTLNDFKNNLGRKVAGTGQTLESVLPGVEMAAARGNIRSPEQLADIAQTLGRARATTGEDTESLAETITDILKEQGRKVTAQSFKQTMDAVQATRVTGAFKTAGEAAQAMSAVTQGLSPEMMKKMGLGTRQIGGLAAVASKAGPGGQDILNHLLQMASKPGGEEQLNALLGARIFKNGKLDMAAFQKINPHRMGQYTEQVLSQATGASQSDLQRFLTSMGSGVRDFKKVTEGSNEAADQFQTATDNLATRIDRFKEGAKEAGREIGESVALFGKDLLSGHLKEAGKDMGQIGKSAWENKGTVLGALGIATGAAVLMGSGAKGLLSKMPGMAKGIGGGVLEGEALKAMGVQPVYVVNASEIAQGKGGIASAFMDKIENWGKKAAGIATGAAGAAEAGAGELGGLGMAGTAAMWGGGAALAGGVGYGAGWLLNKGIDKITGPEGLGGMIYDALHPEEQSPEASTTAKTTGTNAVKDPGIHGLSKDDIRTAVHDGTVSAHEKIGKGSARINPSHPAPRGGSL